MAKVEAPFNDESQNLLDKQVCKGQPKFFVLVYKGMSVVSLILSKKPNFDRLITKALSSGLKGSTACGIIQGSGAKLVLQLPASEAVAASLGVQETFEEDPIAPAKVKGFVEQHAGFKGTVAFEFVRELDKLSKVEVPNDELKVSNKEPLAPEVNPNVDQQQQQQPPPPSFEDLYKDMLGEVEFDVKRLAKSNSAVAAKLAAALDAARQSALNGDFKAAWERVNKVATVIAATASDTRNDETNADASKGIAQDQQPNVDLTLTRVRTTASTLSLAWEKTRLKAIDQIKKAHPKLLEICDLQPNIAEVIAKSPRLFEIPATLDRRLTERLDESAQCTNRDLARRNIARSRALVEEYRAYVEQSPLVIALDGAAGELEIEPISPFLRKTLDVLTIKLKDAADLIV